MTLYTTRFFNFKLFLFCLLFIFFFTTYVSNLEDLDVLGVASPPEAVSVTMLNSSDSFSAASSPFSV